jgi:hypothetical protein
MLYSQINYLGCFLKLSDEIMDTVKTSIANYVGTGIRMAERRIFEPKSNGGLGLFRIREFLDAQKCMWLKRALNLDELWKINLYVKSPNNIFRISQDMFSEESESVFFFLRQM